MPNSFSFFSQGVCDFGVLRAVTQLSVSGRHGQPVPELYSNELDRGPVVFHNLAVSE